MLVLIPIPSRGSKVVIFLISTKRDPRLYGIMWIHWIARLLQEAWYWVFFFFFFCLLCRGGKDGISSYIIKKIKKIKTLLPLNGIGLRTSLELLKKKKKSIYNANSGWPTIKNKKNYFQISLFLWISEFLCSF